MTLRVATADDLAAIMDLERTSFPTDAWSKAMMREELLSPHGRYLVDVEAGRLVGYGGVRAVARAAPPTRRVFSPASSAMKGGAGCTWIWPPVSARTVTTSGPPGPTPWGCAP